MSRASGDQQLMDALDPLLVRAGFQRGQGGGGTVIHCASYADLRERFPRLPQARGQDEHAYFACVDLTWKLDADRLVGVDLEGLSLEATLRQVGRDADADAVAEQLDAPVAAALPVLAGVLSRLFDVAP
jgi:hypothetical protein